MWIFDNEVYLLRELLFGGISLIFTIAQAPIYLNFDCYNITLELLNHSMPSKALRTRKYSESVCIELKPTIYKMKV
jgi:hypothetical protein